MGADRRTSSRWLAGMLIGGLVGVPGSALAGAPAGEAMASEAAAGRHGHVRVVTLAEVLEQARARSSDAMRAEARTELGVAEQAAAAPLLPDNPSVYLGVGGRGSPLGLSLEVQAQVSQPIEIAGERRMRRRAASAYRDALAQQHELWQWRAQVHARAAFHLALVERRRAEAAAAAESFSRTVVDTTAVLVSAGEESPLRLRLAKAELAQAQQARQDADYRYRAACNRLAALVGWPPDEVLRPRGELPVPRSPEGPVEGPVEGPGEGPVEGPAEGPVASGPATRDASDHPAVQAVQAEVDAAQAQLTAARRDAWPHPSVGVYLAREREPGTPFASGVALATISLPLPLWRRNQGPRARAQARLRVAKTERTVVARDLARERQRARDALDTAARRLATYAEEVLPRFSENLELVRRSFELGEIDVLEVFVARERFLRLQDEALDVYVDYIEAARDLALAAGDGVHEG